MGRYILYSPGYGAGWSTWHSSNKEARNFMLTYQPLIDACLAGATPEQLKEIIEHEFIPDFIEKFGEDDPPYTGGGKQLRAGWVDSPFYIREYDGSESIIIGGDVLLDPDLL